MQKLVKFRTITLVIVTATIISCSTRRPNNINNACSIVHQFPDWYYSMVASYERWGVPLDVQMAFIRQESYFISNAKPPMRYYLGFIPKGRASSAYGYAQALDGTWDNYKKETKQYSVSRSNFADAVDFIGWYLNNVHNQIGLSRNDAYQLYLAYHEGIGGYRSGSYKNNLSLKSYARKTARLAQRYSAQLQNCKVPKKKTTLLSYIF